MLEGDTGTGAAGTIMLVEAPGAPAAPVFEGAAIPPGSGTVPVEAEAGGDPEAAGPSVSPDAVAVT